MVDEKKNEALEAEEEYRSAVEEAYDYVENFDILETITNVGNDEVFTPRRTADLMLDSLPEEVWHNPNYKWLNPATKNGIFEREIAIRLDKGLEAIIPDTEVRRKHILQNMIFSIGQTKFTSNVARRTLYYCSQANRQCDGEKAPDGHYVNGYAIGNGTWFNDAEGNILTPSTDHIFVDSSGRSMPSSVKDDDRKKYKCKFCGITADSRYVDPKQREQYAYELTHVYRLVLQKHLRTRFKRPAEEKNMKFDIIIGNPPYQLQVNESGKGLGAIPIYQNFITQAKYLEPKYLCMIIPSRWFSGGVGLDDFRREMLKDDHIKLIYDFSDSKDCFPGVDINGGVCFFLRDSSYSGECEFTNVTNGVISTKKRKLNEFDIFIRRNDALSIVKKILAKKEKMLSAEGGCSPQTPYGFLSTFQGTEKKTKNDDAEILTSKGWRFVERRLITKSYDTVDKYKTMISKLTCEHAGTPDKNGMYRVLSRMELLKPGQICSQSYLTICPQSTEQEALNVFNYLRTKLVRFLIQLTLTGMNMSIANFKFVPWLDFTESWDDAKLYERYGLSDEEIAVVESVIREMA
jgi:site-specific DNA-methyltransferase (adenine-specific)